MYLKFINYLNILAITEGYRSHNYVFVKVSLLFIKYIINNMEYFKNAFIS